MEHIAKREIGCGVIVIVFEGKRVIVFERRSNFKYKNKIPPFNTLSRFMDTVILPLGINGENLAAHQVCPFHLIKTQSSMHFPHTIKKGMFDLIAISNPRLFNVCVSTLSKRENAVLSLPYGPFGRWVLDGENGNEIIYNW